MNSIQKIKGFADLFPPESALYVQMEQTARDIFSRFGFYEIRLPLVERTELFARSIGGETDIVQKEMYTFADRKGRSMTLRPEATAGVVRAYIEGKVYARESVSKLFTCGPMFRYERPQKGRQRQFHQVNAEVLGTEAPQADAELILMLWTYIRRLGLEKPAIEMNSLGCPQCRPAYRRELSAFLAGVDESALCEDCRRRRESNPLRVLDCKVPTCREQVLEAPRTVDHLCPACAEHYQVVLDILAAAGLPYNQNSFLVRGLDYYQRTTFEIVSGDIGAQAAVAGGGRYDGLVHDLGGPEIPGIGFACGMERLAMLMRETEPHLLDFYLAVLDDQAHKESLLLAQRLRERGFSGEVSFEAKSPKSQIRLANKMGAKTCLFLGSEELAKGRIMVKDMATGAQRSVDQNDVEQALGLHLD